MSLLQNILHLKHHISEWLQNVLLSKTFFVTKSEPRIIFKEIPI